MSTPNPHASLVMTTIFDTPILDAYYANLARYGRLAQTRCFVIPDRKTPPAVFDACTQMTARGLECVCPSLDEQEVFLKRVGFPVHGIPYNSDNRRNVGYLMALESASDLVISIDDDNYCTEGSDFIGGHSVVTGGSADHECVESVTGFLNICALLDFRQPMTVYPRGFPYLARHRDEAWKTEVRRTEVMVNAGLWLHDPDIDGMTWLIANPHVTSFSKPSVVLGKGSWTPVNSQNTAMRQSVIPSYYFIRMGYAISGMAIDRYGDIFSGYFTEACVKHVGGSIRIGTPVVNHVRNSHNYLNDATHEMACILVLEDFLPWLREARLSGRTCAEAYLSLSYLMEDAAEGFHGKVWTDTARAYFHQTAYWMRAWLRACQTIQGA
jgi:hypothetical protein